LIKAITFDLWNTLISDKDYTDQRVKCLANTLRKMNISRSYAEIREAYTAFHTYAHKVWRDENYRYVTLDERLTYILKQLSVELKEDLRRKVLEEFEEVIVTDPPSLIEGVRETLELLSPKYKMGIICDTGITPGRVLRKVLEEHRVLRFFHVTVFSDEVGYTKPHKTMFETALQSLGVEASEAIHVGDLLHTDITGAEAIGMKTVWLNRKGTADSGSHKPDYEIETFPELIYILNSIC